MAQILNHKEDYEYFMKRSQNWKNIFDKETGFMRPKKNGCWDKPFDPREVNNNFTEGNSWHYSFFVPQDIPGMIEVYGGSTKFEAKLDEMFNSESKTTGREQVDVTGLIGQYAYGNEPSHHMTYLYNYIGKPEKTKEKVHYILNEFYKNTPDGLIGNEDCGQMSAWYVLSSIGLYQVTPGQDFWQTTDSPYFSKTKVNLENGKSNFVSLPNERTGLLNQEGREITAEKSFDKIIPVPVIQAESKAFKDKLIIELKSQNSNDKIYFKINNYVETLEKKSFEMYNQPFEIQQNATISCYVLNNNYQSNTVSAQFFKKPNNYIINIKSKYNPQYHAGGPEALIDVVFGTENWKKGEWHGYQSQDFEAVIDLQVEKSLTLFQANFLQDSRSWILMPTELEFLVSTDNINFTSVGSLKINDVNPKENETVIKNYGINLAKPQKARYVKVISKNFGKLPERHQGFGGDAFIFIDEITVK